MTDPIAFPGSDPELEGRLRTLLADRAATIDASTPDLPVAAGPRVLAPAGRPRRRWALVGVAAAAAAVVVAGAVVALRDGEPDRVTATQPTAPEPSVGDVATRTLPVYRVNGPADPADVARTYLLVRLGDGTTERREQVDDELRLDVGAPRAHLGVDEAVPVTWHLAGAPASAFETPDGPATMTVWLHRGENGTDVIEAAVDGVDLSGVRYDPDHVRGAIDLPGPPSEDGYGTTTVAVLQRTGAMPLLEPDAPATAPEGAPLAQVVPTSAPFDLTVETSGDVLLTIRSLAADGRPVALAERALAAPPDPEMEGFDDLTPEQQRELMEQRMLEGSRTPSPGCQEAGAFRMPELGGFPNQVQPASATPSDDVIAGGAGSETGPTAAADDLASALDVAWDVGSVELFRPDSGYATARLPGGRLVDLDLYRDPDTDAWRVTQARTRGACRDFGGSNATPIGAPNPVTTLGLPVVAGAVDGTLWYRTEAGTEQVDVGTHELGTHWINVAADQSDITGRATVLRDASGTPVLVDLTPDLTMPG